MNRKRLLTYVLALVLAIVLIVVGVVVWKKQSQVWGQNKLIRTANTAYSNDPRYVNFGVDYLFAVPSAFSVDEASISGTQLVMPHGLETKVDKVDQLFDAAVVAVQPLPDVKANDNEAVKNYVNKTLVPELKKNVSPDVTAKFHMPGKFQSATIKVTKGGKQIRQIYVYGGAHPYTVAAKEASESYNQVVATMISTSDSKNKNEVPLIKKAVQDSLLAIQKGEVQKLYDMGSAEFKKGTSPDKLSDALKQASNFVSRGIIVLGGTLLNDRFTSQVYYASDKKEEQVGFGLVNLQKEDGQWKVNGVNLPTKKK